MKAQATALGHPIHPMLIVFPLGLLPVGLIFDLIYWFTTNSRWADVAYWMIAAGIIGALLAAVFGTLDWLKIPQGTRAWSIGLVHGISNIVVAGLFIVSWLLRRPNPAAPTGVNIALEVIAVLTALFSGWLGGELVYRLNMGVDEGANLNAPNSITQEPMVPHEREAAHR
jgi:uncharacterized membrane protein